MANDAAGNPEAAGPADGGGYAPTGNPADPNEHRHGDVVHSHARPAGPHEHGDDYEYDEAHDPDQLPPPRGPARR
jgi:hypothetical protein